MAVKIDACVKSGDRQKKTAISTHQQGQRELLSTFGGGIKIVKNLKKNACKKCESAYN